MELKIDFTDKEITPWSGMAFMQRMMKKTGLEAALLRAPLPIQGSNRGYAPEQLIQQFLVSVWCGASKYEHCEVSRQDEVIRDIFGWEKMAGHKAFERYFKKFGQGINQRVFGYLYQWFFNSLQFDNYTLDLDSSVKTRYGEQEGSRKGYNPHKPGRKSHHPLMAFVSDCRMVANYWLRSGDAHTANNFASFLEDTLQHLKGKRVGLLRADSGFYSKEVLDYLENKERAIPYIVAVRMYSPIQKKIAAQRLWMEVESGIEIAETTYQSPLWKKPRRIVMVRQYVPLRPQAAGRTLRLFKQEELYRQYRYSCFVTNIELPALQVWRLYRGRADAENRIKELKYDFGAGSFNTHHFFATEAALNFVMLAYNLMSLFRQAVLKTEIHSTLKTLRYKVFAIGGYIIKEGNSHILKLSLAMKRREWFRGLWAKSLDFDIPVAYST